MWDATADSKVATESVGLLPGRRTFGPLFLMTVCPLFTIFLWNAYANDGSVVTAVGAVYHRGSAAIIEPWVQNLPEWAIWQRLALFVLFELTLMKFPASVYHGPVTPKGNVPVYRANGMPAFLITMATAVSLHVTGLFALDSLYDDMGKYLVALNIFAPLFCLFLYIKGVTVPSSTDAGTSGNLVFDYYWGVELYPRILSFDVKTFTNCRFGMMLWPVMVLAFMTKQAKAHGHVTNSMLVSAGIQYIYLAKFYWWETGYLSSIDIMHDHAGYYIVYGCLSWVPIVYTSPGLYLVNRPFDMPTWLAALIFVLGAICVWINYDSDRQRQNFRLAHGTENVWGTKPSFIVAEYQTGLNETKKSLLLCSGWWGLSRHFHYVPEILAAAMWTLPGGFDSALQWFYVVYLTILLADRAWRDDARCRGKYGKYWERYCDLVPYRIVPWLI